MALKHAKLIQYRSTLFHTFLIWTLFPSDFNILFLWCLRRFWIVFPLDILDLNSTLGGGDRINVQFHFETVALKQAKLIQYMGTFCFGRYSRLTLHDILSIN